MDSVWDFFLTVALPLLGILALCVVIRLTLRNPFMGGGGG
jgi:hypothetical protein